MISRVVSSFNRKQVACVYYHANVAIPDTDMMLTTRLSYAFNDYNLFLISKEAVRLMCNQ